MSETPTAPSPRTEVPPWSLPKPQRPPVPYSRYPLGLAFFFFFNAGILLISTFQLLAYPLSLHPATKQLYTEALVFTKGSFGKLCVFITQWFGETEFVVTFGEGFQDGADESEWVERDGRGRVRSTKLPDKGVWMANHQTLSDWLYIWSFAYLTSHHSSILITLKASLRSIPFVGWACSLWGFIFLARAWATDKGPFKSQLESVAEGLRAHEGSGGEGKLALLIFPEGTLVTGNTRPISKKFADKIGVPDFKHTLLPRSTGLFFALRTLATTVPDLHLIDLTIAYPGPTAPYWPEDYFSLLTWFDGISPPAIHVHLRKYAVNPTADAARSNASLRVPLGQANAEGEGTEEEKKVFDEWLRERWGEKDRLIERFMKEGGFEGLGIAGEKGLEEKPKGSKVVWPVKLRAAHEHLEAFCYGIPALFGWFVAAPVLGQAWRLLRGGDAAGHSRGDAVAVPVKECCRKKAAASAAASAAALAASTAASSTAGVTASFGDL